MRQNRTIERGVRAFSSVDHVTASISSCLASHSFPSLLLLREKGNPLLSRCVSFLFSSLSHSLSPLLSSPSFRRHDRVSVPVDVTSTRISYTKKRHREEHGALPPGPNSSTSSVLPFTVSLLLLTKPPAFFSIIGRCPEPVSRRMKFAGYTVRLYTDVYIFGNTVS